MAAATGRPLLPASACEGWLLFSSHYTHPEMDPRERVRGAVVGPVGG